MANDRQTCEAIRDVIGRSISSDAAVPEIAAARTHLERCEACREVLKQMQEDDRELTRFAESHRGRISELELRTVSALAEQPVRQAGAAGGWRRLMATGARRTAAVAALAAILFFVIFLQGPDSSFDAWADVIETVRQATSAQFRLKTLDGSNVEARQAYTEQGTYHRTYEDGELTEALYVDFENREMVYVAHPLKLAARMSIDETMVVDFREHDPALTFDFLQEYEYQDLGSRRIDGRSAVGIRITDARFLAQRMDRAELELWVDPETKLPIRFDVTGEVAGSGRTKHVRFHKFRWNESVDSSEFRPDIPRDYDLITGVELRVDEEHFIAGLRLFADVVDRYPASLAYESLKVELWRSPGARRRDVGKMVLEMFQIRLASDFYGELVKDEREVVYNGRTVRPGDDRRVLMHWQVDDGRHRVVFGDLATETVDADRLVELELLH